jgi:hypothetical protein
LFTAYRHVLLTKEDRDNKWMVVDIKIYPDRIIYLKHRYVTTKDENAHDLVDLTKLETNLIIRHVSDKDCNREAFSEKDEKTEILDLF